MQMSWNKISLYLELNFVLWNYLKICSLNIGKIDNRSSFLTSQKAINRKNEDCDLKKDASSLFILNSEKNKEWKKWKTMLKTSSEKSNSFGMFA